MQMCILPPLRLRRTPPQGEKSLFCDKYKFCPTGEVSPQVTKGVKKRPVGGGEFNLTDYPNQNID